MAAKKSPATKKAPAKKVASKKRAPKKNPSAPKSPRKRSQAQGSAAERRARSRLNRELEKRQREAAVKLKIEHLRFANGLLMGLTQTAAYYEAYPHTESTPDAVRSSASDLARREDLVAYINVMKESEMLATAHDRDWKRRALVEITERSMELTPLITTGRNGKEVKGLLTFDGPTAIRAIAEMNKMDGDYAEENINVTQETHAQRVKRLAAMRSK